jgi:lysyl-tRNA synthetase class 2
MVGYNRLSLFRSGRPLALDENIYQLRLDKLKQIEALGQRVYPTKYEFTHTIPQIIAEHSPQSAETFVSPVALWRSD